MNPDNKPSPIDPFRYFSLAQIKRDAKDRARFSLPKSHFSSADFDVIAAIVYTAVRTLHDANIGRFGTLLDEVRKLKASLPTPILPQKENP